MRRTLVGAIALLAALSVASPAWALDAYRDRNGLFAGFSLGGGAGFADYDDGRTGLDDGRVVGFGLGLTAGGGASDRLVLAAELDWWMRSVESGDDLIDHDQLSFLVLARYFVLEGLFVEGGGGLAHAAFDADRGAAQLAHVTETGLAARVGAGYEMFMTGDLATGFGLNYTTHLYDTSRFDSVNGAILLRWY